MRFAISSGLLIASAFTLSAQAGQQTGNMTVRAELVEACSLVTNDLNFGTGTYSELIGKQSTAQITVNCPATTNWSVSLDGGLHTGATVNSGQREIHHTQGGSVGSGVFDYYILYDNGVAQPFWGDGSSVLQGDPVNGSGQSTLTAIAQITAGFASGNTAGVYSDTVTVTLDY